ncbi:MAG: ATP-dependent 6-phosphofructokinase [Spirochaetales bacterium]
MPNESPDFTIPALGEAKVPSPIKLSRSLGDRVANYVDDNARIIFDVDVSAEGGEYCVDDSMLLQKAGPREHVYFPAARVHAGVVTCGGLCPGINDVIRALTRCLWYQYGVRRITGIPFGYHGLLPECTSDTIRLDPNYVDDIHKIGGTCLGSSRGGGERTVDIVDSLERMNLNMLFCIGGDGTQKGALAIAEEVERRGLKIAVVGIPKTIDNDLSFIQKSFGFETAVSIASGAVTSAHTEAHSAMNGIGLVKLMGRDSGFIAAHTALACHEANFVLIPEVPFELEGEYGLFAQVQKRLERRNHAVIVVAEGAGQDLLRLERGTEEARGTDASGNERYGDIGVFLRERLREYFAAEGININLKYIDPSYIIRSAVAAPTDSVYCSRLGNNAVHAAMAGKTKVLISLVNNEFVHVPIAVVVGRRSVVDPESSLWRDVVESTQQPIRMVAR